ncbi:MAG: biopolymer transporter Tol [Pirellulales bacterium]|nr:biopolymer transporter Tol [Pirellulales bacterium]
MNNYKHSLASWAVLPVSLVLTLGMVGTGGHLIQDGKQTGSNAAQATGDQSSLESKYLHNVRQVTSGFTKAGEGYFSPDGKTIVYQAISDTYPFYQIYKQPLVGGTPQLLSRGRGRTTCAYFSPDGKKILFASSHTDPQLDKTEADAIRQAEEDARNNVRRRYQWDFDPHMEIYEANLDGKNLTPLTNAPGYDAEGAYSVDGKSIAFCSMRDGDPDIFLMNSDGSNLRQITNAPGYDGGPFVSPDGNWIVFRSDREKKDYLQIHVIGVDGQNETALTDNNGVNWGPYWHPTQPYLIWSGADHSDPTKRPNYDLWVMKYKIEDGKFIGGEKTRITDNIAADVLPVFSPDGRKLMWTSTRTENRTSQLFIADVTLPGEER